VKCQAKIQKTDKIDAQELKSIAIWKEADGFFEEKSGEVLRKKAVGLVGEVDEVFAGLSQPAHSGFSQHLRSPDAQKPSSLWYRYPTSMVRKATAFKFRVNACAVTCAPHWIKLLEIEPCTILAHDFIHAEYQTHRITSHGVHRSVASMST
jgi:hypothetical protein